MMTVHVLHVSALLLAYSATSVWSTLLNTVA